MIDIKIEDIKISLTESAFQQIQLIWENDYQIGENVFRLKVDGKGCGGFDYAMGFTPIQDDDLVYSVSNNDFKLNIHLDPFTAFYGREGEIDFIQDFANNTEGFHFENINEKKYRGKFFKDESTLPPEIS